MIHFMKILILYYLKKKRLVSCAVKKISAQALEIACLRIQLYHYISPVFIVDNNLLPSKNWDCVIVIYL